LANEEYASLKYLSENWVNEYNFQFVKPLEFLKQYNAIITERFYAEYFFKMYRKCSIKREHSKNKELSINILSRLRAALSNFHRKNIVKSKFNSHETILKIKNYCKDLEKRFKCCENELISILK